MSLSPDARHGNEPRQVERDSPRVEHQGAVASRLAGVAVDTSRSDKYVGLLKRKKRYPGFAEIVSDDFPVFHAHPSFSVILPSRVCKFLLPTATRKMLWQGTYGGKHGKTCICDHLHRPAYGYWIGRFTVECQLPVAKPPIIFQR